MMSSEEVLKLILKCIILPPNIGPLNFRKTNYQILFILQICFVLLKALSHDSIFTSFILNNSEGQRTLYMGVITLAYFLEYYCQYYCGIPQITII